MSANATKSEQNQQTHAAPPEKQ